MTSGYEEIGYRGLWELQISSIIGILGKVEKKEEEKKWISELLRAQGIGKMLDWLQNISKLIIEGFESFRSQLW